MRATSRHLSQLASSTLSSSDLKSRRVKWGGGGCSSSVGIWRCYWRGCLYRSGKDNRSGCAIPVVERIGLVHITWCCLDVLFAASDDPPPLPHFSGAVVLLLTLNFFFCSPPSPALTSSSAHVAPPHPTPPPILTLVEEVVFQCLPFVMQWHSVLTGANLVCGAFNHSVKVSVLAVIIFLGLQQQF